MSVKRGIVILRLIQESELECWSLSDLLFDYHRGGYRQPMPNMSFRMD